MKTATLEYYQDALGEWRWSFKAPNGKIVADSAEGYKRRNGAINGFRSLSSAVHGLGYKVAFRKA